MSSRRQAFGRVAPWLAVLIAGVAMLSACGDDDDETSPTSAPASSTVVTETASTPAPSTVPVTSAEAPTTPAPTTAPSETTEPSAPGSTAPPPVVALSGETLEVASPLLANPFGLERVGVFGGLVVYDGESVDGDFSLRCIAVGHEGETSWSEWCALPGDSSSFVVVEDINPWVVDVGAEHLDVTMTQMPSDWAVTSSGCVDPIVTLIDASEIEYAVATSIACAGDEAVVSFSGVYMQPGSGDGLTVLITKGDEGWNRLDYGTALFCSGYEDGVDRCALFGVDEELFEALSPIPSPEHLPAQQNYVAVREVTDDVQSMAADATDLDAITEAIVTALTPAETETVPAVARHDSVYFNQYTLLVVDVPQLDDSTASVTWAVWITTETPEVPSAVHRAYAWNNCARGVADSEHCV
jgi:hypothetical protein